MYFFKIAHNSLIINCPFFNYVTFMLGFEFLNMLYVSYVER